MSEKTVTPITGGKKTHHTPAPITNNRTAIVEAMAASVTGGAAVSQSKVGTLVAGSRQAPLEDANGEVWPFPVGLGGTCPGGVAQPVNAGTTAVAATAPAETKKPEKLPNVTMAREAEAPVIDKDLLYILATPRGHDGESERAFGMWLKTKIEKMGHKVQIVQEGALYVEVGTSAESTTLFSCHIDTVHDKDVKEPQELLYDPNLKHIMLAPEKPKAPVTPPPQQQPARSTHGGRQYPNYPHGGYHDYGYGGGYHGSYGSYNRNRSCLGADDGAGVWVMLQMLAAGVKGGYLFHRGEERGCISSAAMARNEEKFISSWTSAIAFDRPKDFEIITHQGGSECASDKFAQALADALNAEGGGELEFKISANGGTTDTRQYRSLIPECINVGVGYFDHHSSSEYVDYGHLVALANACCKINWQALPVTRDPKKYAYGGWKDNKSTSTTSATAPKGQAGGSASSSAGKNSATQGATAASDSPKHKAGQDIIQHLYEGVVDYETIIDWFDADPELTAKAFLQALVQARANQVQLNMLLSKTLNTK